MLSIGLMSGTSMDGIDAALIETDGTPHHLQTIAGISMDYDPAFKTLLKAAEYTVRQCQGNWQMAVVRYPEGIRDYLQYGLHISQSDITAHYEVLSTYLKNSVPHPVMDDIALSTVVTHSTALHTQLIKQLLQQANVSAQNVQVIGYHGQTLFHQPDMGISIAMGDGAALATDLQITVVNDFRREDVAAGGQGAPFAPLYHQALSIRDNQIPLAVVNCGGIANITVIPNDNPEDLIAFDTGPGNALLDQLVKQRTHGEDSFDKDGQYAKQGRIHENVLEALYQETLIKNGKNYFDQLPPKSLDYGDLKLISALNTLSLPDACHTLAAFTADSIVRSLALLPSVADNLPKHWVLAGGGWKNPVIYQAFKQRLQAKLGSDTTVYHADDIGWSTQYMEAEIFAYLAVRRLNNQPISFPGTTRVPFPLTGGTIHQVVPKKESQNMKLLSFYGGLSKNI